MPSSRPAPLSSSMEDLEGRYRCSSSPSRRWSRGNWTPSDTQRRTSSSVSGGSAWVVWAGTAGLSGCRGRRSTLRQASREPQLGYRRTTPGLVLPLRPVFAFSRMARQLSRSGWHAVGSKRLRGCVPRARHQTHHRFWLLVTFVWGSGCRSVRWEVRGGGRGARCCGVCLGWTALRARSVGRGWRFVRWCFLRRRFVCWRRQVGLRGVRRRDRGGAGCLKRGSRRAGRALSQARRGVVFGLEGGAGGMISGAWWAAGGRRVVGWPSLGSVG